MERSLGADMVKVAETKPKDVSWPKAVLIIILVFAIFPVLALVGWLVFGPVNTPDPGGAGLGACVPNVTC